MLLALPLVLVSSILTVQASLARPAHHVARNHARISLPGTPLESPVNLRKRKSCKAKTSSSAKSSSTHHTTTKTTHKTTSTKKTTAAAKPTAQVKQSSSPNTIQVHVGRCGPNGATTDITKTTGPNGSIGWLNCGITSGSGWNPPRIQIKDVKFTDLNEALKSSSSPFHPCSAYVSYFYKYAGENGLEAIMLAAFAMQESSCNPNTVGGAGEQGLMQITKDKCGGAPGGNCRDPDFNIRKGAEYFAQTLADNDGDLLLSIGEYNGWYKGLTVSKAEAARHTDCCLCQNNLDYLFQWMNGWILNQNAYALNLGQYHNLDVCD